MQYFAVGLGNPGGEYENTRHNTGARVLEMFRQSARFPEWKEDAQKKALVSEGKVGKRKVLLIFPQTFMNKSGDAVRQIEDLRLKVKDKKKEIENLAIIHDDLDISLGSYKLSFNKSSGGHKGVESVIRALKTQAFARIRVGISPVTSTGAIKKPKGETAVEKHILGEFSAAELATLKKLFPRIVETLSRLVSEGREKAMSMRY